MNKVCKVCSRKSQGVHFGVHSCRACAAFFRRAAGSKLDEIACMNQNCGSDTFLCKPCRLRRCYRLGMDTNKFQFNRDSIGVKKSMEMEIIPQSFSKFIGRPQFVHFCDPDTFHTSTPRMFIDLSYLVEKADVIFETSPAWAPRAHRGPLRKLANFHDVFEKMPKEMATNTEFSPADCSDCWEYYFLTTATWLTNFDEFQQLEKGLKMSIASAIWHMWGRLDKIASTALGRRRGLLKTRSMIAQSNGLFLVVDTLQLDVSWLSCYSLEQVEFFIADFRRWDLMTLVDVLVELDPSEIELNYMLAQLCFHYAAKRFGGRIEEICDRFQEILASDLHEYYVNDRKMPNYLGRLARLMKINNTIQVVKSVWEQRSRTEIAKTLNIFTADFSHPDIFFDTGF